MHHQAIKPFESIVAHPTRATLFRAGKVVEQRANGPHNRHLKSVSVCVDPQFLPWRAHADDQDVWPRRVDFGDDLRRFILSKVAMMDPGG